MKRMCATPYLRLNTVLSTVPDSILYRCTESSSHAVTSRSSRRWKSKELMALVFSCSSRKKTAIVGAGVQRCVSLITLGGTAANQRTLNTRPMPNDLTMLSCSLMPTMAVRLRPAHSGAADSYPTIILGSTRCTPRVGVPVLTAQMYA